VCIAECLTHSMMGRSTRKTGEGGGAPCISCWLQHMQHRIHAINTGPVIQPMCCMHGYVASKHPTLQGCAPVKGCTPQSRVAWA
jgi:hypothetical protein